MELRFGAPSGRRHGGRTFLLRLLEQRHLHGGRGAQSEAQPAPVAGPRRGYRQRALHRVQYDLPERADLRCHPARRQGSRGCRGGQQHVRPGGRAHHGGGHHGLHLRLHQRPDALRRARLLCHGEGQTLLSPGRNAQPQDPRAGVLPDHAMHLGLPAHLERALQRSAGLCYLCCAAVLHFDDRRPVRATSHSPGDGAAVQGLRVPRAARDLHIGGVPHRNLAVAVQTELHVAGAHHRAFGPARLLYLAKEGNRMSSNLFATKSLDRLVNEAQESGAHSLKRTLGPFQLTALGVGAIIGAGIFVMSGLGAQYAGPGLMLSFVLSGLGCAFAGLCYAEFAAMIPLAGSAYTYAYATLGELIAWIIGWDLTLEYAMGASTVSSGWSNYFVELLRILHINFPLWLAYDHWTALSKAIETVSRQVMAA